MVSTRLALSARAAAKVIGQRRLARLTAEKLDRVQARRVRSIVHHAYASVPFYREVMEERGLRPEDFADADDLAQLPLIEHEDVRRDVERFTSTRIPLERRSVLHTSGTARGIRSGMFQDDEAVIDSLAKTEHDRAILMRLAGESYAGSLARELAGLLPTVRRHPRLVDPRRRRQRLSIFPRRGASSTSSTRALWSRRTVMPAHSPLQHWLSASVSVEEQAARLRELRPAIVFSFGSSADRFLRYAFAAGEPIPLPRVWMVTGDMAPPLARELARQLGVRLWSHYGSVESGLLGFECELGAGHHLHVDSCAVRIVDAGGGEVAPGQPGDLVISNLVNRATVILNYRLGDRGAMTDRSCPCGRVQPVLERLEGRVSDLIHLADGRELPALVFDGMFRGELTRALQSQVAQSEPGSVRWSVVPLPGVDGEQLRSDLTARAAVQAPGTRVEIELCDQIPATPSGKARAVA